MAAPARRKVFETPELLSLICSYANRRINLRIMRTNKAGYLSAVPFVWKKVDGIVHLLKLLPRIQIDDDEYSKVQRITLPPLSQSDYARFEFYAPFVKDLELYKGNSYFQISGLDMLCAKKEQGPLLPNLSSFTACLPTYSTACLAQGLTWITSLLSPSLKSLRVDGTEKLHFPVHSTLTGFTVLVALVRTCPGVRTLSLFPFTDSDESDEDYDEDEDDSLLNLLPHEPFLQCFAALRNLSELETNMAIAEPEALSLLGELPRLKHLTLCATPAKPTINAVDFPDYAFPALEHLALKGLRNTEVKKLLSLVSLVRNINSLEVVTTLSRSEGRWIMDDFFPCLENTPHLTNLTATFDEKWIVDRRPDINFPPVLNTLSSLSLLNVYLNGVEFQSYHGDYTKAFPTLTKLDVSSQNMRLENLPCLATIPKLEHLILSLNLDGDDPYPSQNILPACQSLHTIEITDPWSPTWRPRWVCKVAEFLLLLFPNIKQVTHSKAKPGDCAGQEGILWLNSQIDLQRELKMLRNRIADKYGQDETKSLVPKSFPGDVYETR